MAGGSLGARSGQGGGGSGGRDRPWRDCLADVAELRAQVFGLVASDPTISRLIDTLAQDPMGAIRVARATARARVWARHRPIKQDDPVVIDLDAVGSRAESRWRAPR